MLDCDSEGTETSVSHKQSGAALAFKDCVRFLQAFHIANCELVLAINRDHGGRNQSHAQTHTRSPLFSKCIGRIQGWTGSRKHTV